MQTVCDVNGDVRSEIFFRGRDRTDLYLCLEQRANDLFTRRRSRVYTLPLNFRLDRISYDKRTRNRTTSVTSTRVTSGGGEGISRSAPVLGPLITIRYDFMQYEFERDWPVLFLNDS